MVRTMLHPRSQGIFGEGRVSIEVLLIIDNAPGHPRSISIEDENFQVVFLTPNTTSLFQPLDQGNRASHTLQVFDIIRAAIDADPKLQVVDCWKSFAIADKVTFIEAAMDELKPEMVNACWKNLWSEAIYDFKGFPRIDGEVKEIIRTAREVGGEGFVDVIDEELEEHIEEYQEVLTKEELEELVNLSTEEEEVIEVEPAIW